MVVQFYLLAATTLNWCIATACGYDQEDYRLIWEDTFNKWDEEKWATEVDAYGGGNREFQANTPSKENVYIKDNTLYIKPTLLNSTINPQTSQPFGNQFHESGILDVKELYGKCKRDCRKRNMDIPPVLSAHLVSRLSFQYGRVEVTARMSAGDWIVPVIALLPSKDVYGSWPRSGAVTIATSRGNRRHIASIPGVERAEMLMFWGPHFSDFRFQETMKIMESLAYNFADYYHKFTLDWSEQGMVFYLDDVEVWTLQRPENGFWEFGSPWTWSGRNPWINATRMAPFDQEFQLHIWVAVGGNSGIFQDNAEKPWKNDDYHSNVAFWEARDQWLPSWQEEATALKIRSVKIYEHQPTYTKEADIGSGAAPWWDARTIGAVGAAAVIFVAVMAAIAYCCFKQPSVVEERSYHPDGENYATHHQKSPAAYARVSIVSPNALRQQSVESNCFYESAEPHHYISVF